MYLKELKLQGFKSFVGETKFKLKPGVICIVGPNGSGKSNIVDAIRWVLGEQSVKSLRGSKMEHVIFHGTQNKKPVGFAEVCLTIDNSEGRLPVEFSEVTVSRRVYRSGESEFSINKRSCRLKDIYELFLDTGIGRDGYSIIGQGKVDELLSSRPEDRRNIFEEATGIMKYKRKKDEAEKKIEIANQNLVRLDDIINELEIQLVPLEEQSKIAQQYLDIKEKLKQLEVGIHSHNLSKLVGELDVCNQDCSGLENTINEYNTHLADVTKLNQESIEKLKQLEITLEEKRTLLHDIDTMLEKCNSIKNLNNEKIANCNQNIDRLDREIDDLYLEKRDLAKYGDELKEHLSDIEGSALNYRNELQLLQTKLNEIEEKITKSEQDVDNLKKNQIEAINRQTETKIHINKLRTYSEGFELRCQDIQNELQQLCNEQHEEQNRQTSISLDIENKIKKLSEYGNVLEELNKGKKSTDLVLHGYNKNLSEIKATLQFKISKCGALKSIEQNLDGYMKSVKLVLKECQRSEQFCRGIHGALARLITVDSQYETAIEIALGAMLQNIVTDSEAEAKKAIEFLKLNKFGRATFLPISSVKGRSLEQNIISKLRSFKGFCGIAEELVKCLPQYRGIVSNLLGKVVVVTDIDKGIEIAKFFKYTFKIVTLGGDVLNPGGAMAGGSVETKDNSILGRARQIAELEKEISKLKEEAQSLDSLINEAGSKLRQIAVQVKEQEQQMKHEEFEKVRQESILNGIHQNLKKVTARMDMLINEKYQLEEENLTIQDEIKNCVARLDERNKEATEAAFTIEEYESNYKFANQSKDLINKEITEYKVKMGSLTESIKSIKHNLANTDKGKSLSDEKILKKSQQKRENLEQIVILKEQIKESESSELQHIGHKTKVNQEFDEIIKLKELTESEMFNSVDSIEKTNKNLSAVQQKYNKAIGLKTKTEAEMKEIKNKLWEDYEMTQYQADEFKKNINDNIREAKNKVGHYKEHIRQLGNVNISAIEEYEKQKERHEFMSLQRTDMKETCDKLCCIVREMTVVMKKQFVEQFQLINENFDQVFSELFGGGRATLEMTDEKNVLESGIEIQVQPPGKKIQNMMLLSGGEKALTAIALLFAILKLTPTPFCVLDEIEAALDDSNVIRFMEYIKNYSSSTQFIVITHRKGTMEASDILYGVTMQEHGISSIVSLKLE